MSRPSRMLLATAKDGRITLCSPAVGIYFAPPLRGEGLVTGSRAGTLRCLGRVIDLVVPEGSGGRVAQVLVKERASPVAYGDPLIVLVPGGSGALAESAPGDFDAGAATGGEAGPADAPGAEGTHVLRAPTAGVFYSRSDPASPAFVAPGSSLETGQTAGLIEVMKVFSPILHPGGTIPSPAIVVELRARDGQEVSPGQVLFVLRPA